MNKIRNLTQHSPLPILLIEDSDEDYVAFLRVFQQAGLTHTIYRCRDGDEALEFLFHEGRYAKAPQPPRPALILLDLNLPGTDGREVLDRIKHAEKLRSIPVVVLTTSANPRDIEECYRRGANGYQIKSANYEAFKQEMQRTVAYWFETVVVPAAVE